jgi:serralysin
MVLNGPIADAAAYNVSAPDPHDATCLPDLLTPGETVRGKTALDLAGVEAQIDAGRMLPGADDGTITYGFFDFRHALGINNNPIYGSEGKGYTPFTDAQKAATRISIANWDELITAEFEEVTMSKKGARDWAQGTVDIWLANSFTGPLTAGAGAWAYYPDQSGPYKRASSDVWISDPNYLGSNLDLYPGGYGLHTLNHELGHSLGLSHPGAYNAGNDVDITYEDDAEYAQDTHQYSIMSYFDSFEGGNNTIDWNFMRIISPSTPMVHDVWVIQEKYGVETTTRTGDDTYGFNATPTVKNDAMRFEEGEMATMFTIWDAGGTDTLNLSGYHTPSVIDLREGAYSSAGGWNAYGDAPEGADDPRDLDPDVYMAYVNANNVAEGMLARGARYDLYFTGRKDVNEEVPWGEVMGWDFLMENNIGIAYGAVIEHAIGGEGDDRINGNQAQNDFTGNGGADTFIIADYSGVFTRPNAADETINDESIDRILDFDRTEGDKIALCELEGVNGFGDLLLTSVAGGTKVTVLPGDDDLSFIVLGTTPLIASDFTF